jgi:hypothetical protein
LEKGSTATSFDYRPYTTELQLCQRYYEQSVTNKIVIARPDSANVCAASLFFAVEKRATPTMTFPSTTGTFTLNEASTRGASMTSSSVVGYVQTGFTATIEL